jgi:membrane protease YdiL (CAAX protease family)
MLFNLLTEELGWRGYLYHLWRGAGFWRYTVATGVIWGVWHWPMVVLFGMGGDQGLVFNVLFYPFVTTLLAFCLTIIRDRSHSVIAAGIFHGAWNSVSGMRDGIYSVSAVLLVAMLLYAWRESRQRTGDG